MSGLIWVELMVYLKECFEKVDFEKNQQTTKKLKKFPGGKETQEEFA